MPLLARRPPVLVQHRVNEGQHRFQLRLRPRRITVRRRQCPRQRLAHQSAMHPELGGNTSNRSNTKLMLATELLKQIHLGVPIHSELLARPGGP